MWPRCAAKHKMHRQLVIELNLNQPLLSLSLSPSVTRCDPSLAVKKINRWLARQDVGIPHMTPLDPSWPLSKAIMWPSPAEWVHIRCQQVLKTQRDIQQQGVSCPLLSLRAQRKTFPRWFQLIVSDVEVQVCASSLESTNTNSPSVKAPYYRTNVKVDTSYPKMLHSLYDSLQTSEKISTSCHSQTVSRPPLPRFSPFSHQRLKSKVTNVVPPI